jgi:glycosyltransferase involved in cell wall biosynthesis
VVDDGSTDMSRLISIEYSRRFPVIRVLQHPDGRNLGVSASRNLGISRAAGGVLGLLDTDDLVAPSRFTETLDILRRDPAVDAVFDSVGVVFDGSLAAEAWGASPCSFFPKAADGPYAVVRGACRGEIKAFTQSLTIRRRILS